MFCPPPLQIKKNFNNLNLKTKLQNIFNFWVNHDKEKKKMNKNYNEFYLPFRRLLQHFFVSSKVVDNL